MYTIRVYYFDGHWEQRTMASREEVFAALCDSVEAGGLSDQGAEFYQVLIDDQGEEQFVKVDAWDFEGGEHV